MSFKTSSWEHLIPSPWALIFGIPPLDIRSAVATKLGYTTSVYIQSYFYSKKRCEVQRKWIVSNDPSNKSKQMDDIIPTEISVLLLCPIIEMIIFDSDQISWVAFSGLPLRRAVHSLGISILYSAHQIPRYVRLLNTSKIDINIDHEKSDTSRGVNSFLVIL